MPMFALRPRHTLVSVIHQLEVGLKDGTIHLGDDQEVALDSTHFSRETAFHASPREKDDRVDSGSKPGFEEVALRERISKLYKVKLKLVDELYKIQDPLLVAKDRLVEVRRQLKSWQSFRKNQPSRLPSSARVAETEDDAKLDMLLRKKVCFWEKKGREARLRYQFLQKQFVETEKVLALAIAEYRRWREYHPIVETPGPRRGRPKVRPKGQTSN